MVVPGGSSVIDLLAAQFTTDTGAPSGTAPARKVTVPPGFGRAPPTVAVNVTVLSTRLGLRDEVTVTVRIADGLSDCRGANNDAEHQRQLAKEVVAGVGAQP